MSDHVFARPTPGSCCDAVYPSTVANPQAARRMSRRHHGGMDDLRSASGLAAALGARVPIIAAPMAGGPSSADLVSATAAAGGLGFIAGGYASPDALRERIDQVSSRTRTFGVNLFAPNPVPVDLAAFARYAGELQPLARRYGIELDAGTPVEDDDAFAAKVEVLAEASVAGPAGAVSGAPVPVVSFTFGLPDAEVVRRLREVGAVLVQTVTGPAEAVAAERLGVDAVVLQGWRAGGHSGTLTPQRPVAPVELAALVAAVREVSGLPIWAAGGIANHRDVGAVLEAGAEAAVVGTALLRTPESGAGQAHRDALADPRFTTTELTAAFSGRPARSLRNAFVRRHSAGAPLGYPAVHHLTSPLRRAASAAGDADQINLWAGTGYRQALAVPAAEVIRTLARVCGGSESS